MGDTVATNRVLSLARTLLAKGGGGFESISGGEDIDREQLTEALENRILLDDKMASELPSSVTAKVAAAEALANAESALNKTAGGESPSNLTDLEIAGLEAIVEVTGRPAMRYSNGKVQTPSSSLGENGQWKVLIVTARTKINSASASVGRIATTNNFGIAEAVGTGWRTGSDLIVTNRHVVSDMVTNRDASPSMWKMDGAKHPFIDFAATDGALAPLRFEITEIVYVASEGPIDLAFVRIASISTPLPDALNVDWAREGPGREIPSENAEQRVFQGREIYVVGHPYRQRQSELVTTVFGVADGMKRWSPGLVKRIDNQKPLLEHDCSTLGGNSGSCVFTTDTHEVIGIHIGGIEVDDATAKGSANLALALSRLDTHPAAEIIRTGKL